MKPAAQPVADAVLQPLAVDCGVVEIVGREDRCPLRVVAAVDHVVENILHELRRFLRSELVEHQKVGLEQRAQNLRFADRSIGVETSLNLLNEILEIAEEHPSRFSRVNDLDKRRDG